MPLRLGLDPCAVTCFHFSAQPPLKGIQLFLIRLAKNNGIKRTLLDILANTLQPSFLEGLRPLDRCGADTENFCQGVARDRFSGCNN